MGNTLTRADLIDALGREVGLSRNDCSDLLESLLENLAKALERGELVKLARSEIFQYAPNGPESGETRKQGLRLPSQPAVLSASRPPKSCGSV